VEAVQVIQSTIHTTPVCRFYGVLNALGLYNKEAKILFLVRLFSLCGALIMALQCSGGINLDMSLDFLSNLVFQDSSLGVVWPGLWASQIQSYPIRMALSVKTRIMI
jgi:hypothetical protein